jgi:hypothetical protein
MHGQQNIKFVEFFFVPLVFLHKLHLISSHEQSKLSIEQGPCETNSSSISQEMSRLVYNLEVHGCVYRS